MYSNNYRRCHGFGSFAAAALVCGAFLAAGGCRSDAQTGTLIGSGLGAGIGAIIGHNVSDRGAEGALIGAGVGAVGGYMIGNESDKKRAWRHSNYDY